MDAGFTLIDWVVVLATLGAVTWLGHAKSGRQDGARDFFLGGRRLPWYAVSASIVATEISAVTYVSLPWLVYRDGGDLTYLQVVFGGYALARVLVGLFLVPVYYRREIFSPYDHVGHRLGVPARRTASSLFAFGGVLAQSSRVYLTALVLEVLLQEQLMQLEAVTGAPPLVSAVAIIGVVAVAWTWMGGIAAVVWTDAALFVLFLLGAAACLFTAGSALEGGLGAGFEAAREAGKLRLIDPALDLTRPYTLPAALLGAGVGGVAAFGTNQLMVQRLLCCPDVRSARRAVIASTLGSGVVAVVACVGIALWAYYREHPMDEVAAGLLAEKGDRLLPIFVAGALAPGLKGLVVAGAFAAAISSLDSNLAALAQSTAGLGARDRSEAALLRRSRALVVVWGLVLCAAAVGIEVVAERYGAVLDLALSMAGYTEGALLAGVLLAVLPGARDGLGYVLGAPLSVLAVFGVVWHEPWAQQVALAGGVLCAGSWVLFAPDRRAWQRGLAIVAAGPVLAVWAAGLLGAVSIDLDQIPISLTLAFALAPTLTVVLVAVPKV